MPDEITVYVVDDDADARDSVQALVSSMGIRTQSYPSAEAFLESYRDGDPGCLVTDFRMLGMSGLELQNELNRRNIFLPVVVLTAFARTPLTVRALKAGAVTLLEKPYEEDDLWDAIRQALAEDATHRAQHEKIQTIQKRIAELTSTERQVMEYIVQGCPNKTIAKKLDVSVRTVEAHRHNVFRKMKADCVAALVKQVIQAVPEKD